jgi:hypothetical protein
MLDGRPLPRRHSRYPQRGRRPNARAQKGGAKRGIKCTVTVILLTNADQVRASEKSASHTEMAIHTGLGLVSPLWSLTMSEEDINGANAAAADRSTAAWCLDGGNCPQ